MSRPRPALLATAAAFLSALGVVAAGAAPAQTATAAGATAAQTAAALPEPTTARHYIANLQGAVAGPRSVGFNVFDTGASTEQVDALPSGVQAMVWLGQKCPTPADASFRDTVQRLARNPKVFGYYLSDEPHVADCPGGPKALASRAAFVRDASGGRQRSFIVLSETPDYKAFRPAVTGVSMIGIDAYPCSDANPDCNPAKIDEKVGLALSNGIPRGRIVPVFQAFGQRLTQGDRYYRQPTARQMRPLLARWARLVPSPPMDYTYGWGHQASANPTLVDSLQLRRLLRGYFAG